MHLTIALLTAAQPQRHPSRLACQVHRLSHFQKTLAHIQLHSLKGQLTEVVRSRGPECQACLDCLQSTGSHAPKHVIGAGSDETSWVPWPKAL